MTVKEYLESAVELARAALYEAEDALEKFKDSPENNVFLSLNVALGEIEDRLYSKASEACEGPYNCGEESYSQEFIVEGVHYIGTLECDYNRHDKTYYYIDGSRFSHTLK